MVRKTLFISILFSLSINSYGQSWAQGLVYIPCPDSTCWGLVNDTVGKQLSPTYRQMYNFGSAIESIGGLWYCPAIDCAYFEQLIPATLQIPIGFGKTRHIEIAQTITQIDTLTADSILVINGSSNGGINGKSNGQ